MPTEAPAPPALPRVVGVPGAVLLGLGSIVGTGIFVSVGVAAGVAGPAVVLAVVLAAAIAACNGLSSAQLAAAHPVSGGTYEYGHRYLNPTLGFVAGWMFLCAKSASAATAALGLGGYALALAGVSGRGRIALAVGVVAFLTAIVAGGLRRSSRTNVVIVGLTLAALAMFVLAGAPLAIARAPVTLDGLFDVSAPDLLHATALMFVAYTGYGRIATLGEEVRDPARTIPRAIILTLVASLVVYGAVTLVAVAVAGAGALAPRAGGAAPLERAAGELGVPGLRLVIALGAITAMAGVVLNLLLGLSRVVLAMARRGDLPAGLAHVGHDTPRRAVVLVGVAIAGLTLIGSVETTWSFSAFTVLVYYALTNLAALRQPAAERRHPRAIAAAGLVACLGLAWWVEPRIWLAGLALIAGGLVARAGYRATRR